MTSSRCPYASKINRLNFPTIERVRDVRCCASVLPFWTYSYGANSWTASPRLMLAERVTGGQLAPEAERFRSNPISGTNLIPKLLLTCAAVTHGAQWRRPGHNEH